MCGIAGIIGSRDRDSIDAMVAAMRHRGPDDAGTWADDAAHVMLGNRRLAIQDLSPAGHMPMSDGTRWITYNGEVYNFPTLRTALEQNGHTFRSGSDTEVILAAYREWGTDCLHHLRGMFAFAIYDPTVEDGRLFLARDHFGIKPLYWSRQDHTFVFASEIRAVLASGLVRRQINLAAVWDYLSFGSVIPPETIISDVFALLPGHAMLVSRTDQHIWRWWDLAEAAQNTAIPDSLEEAAAEVRRLLDESVRLQRISDVPVGAFLSGGIDSSTIVGLMSAHVNEPIHTFSVAFRTQGGHADELDHARTAAERFGTTHHPVIVGEDEISRRFDTIIRALDQPSIDGINSYLVAEAARQHITVSLSGVGGDELFAGYPQFGRFWRAAQRFPTGNRTLHSLTRVFGHYLPGRWRGPLEFQSADPLARHGMVRRFHTQTQKSHLVNSALFEAFHARTTDDFYRHLLLDHLDPISQVSYIETRGYMAHTLLRDVDVMSMAHSLEVRVPFVDHVVAQFVFALPPQWKWHGSGGKRVLRDAMADLLPHDTLTRQKAGFDLPLSDWIRHPLQARFQDVLSSPVAEALLSRDALAVLKNGASHYTGHSQWNVLVLLCWLQLSEVDIA